MTKLEIAALLDNLRSTARHRFVQPAIDAAEQLRREVAEAAAVEPVRLDRLTPPLPDGEPYPLNEAVKAAKAKK